ncbi:hypothetical protein Nepgr_032968 [Nepenthes gracilis]|uniref:Trichome birefringence-like N-terminal domain-containing protein n=1 Tax=Nepenthes gracilis TaxID=150966 RepID=A0AAD3Y821_NEPGR|nr:hypothetical protein Nepgr_032968 [Nepenthes gracilis]
MSHGLSTFSPNSSIVSWRSSLASTSFSSASSAVNNSAPLSNKSASELYKSGEVKQRDEGGVSLGRTQKDDNGTVSEKKILRNVDVEFNSVSFHGEANYSIKKENLSAESKEIKLSGSTIEAKSAGRRENGGNSSSWKVGKSGLFKDLGNSEEKIQIADSKNGNCVAKECDYFDGRWVRDETKPYYPPGSCPYIDNDFNCHLNERPDYGYLRWKWQPNCCDIPSLNATDFLQRLTGKKLIFVGDSLNRNMWESLVCILRHGIRKKNRVYEISGRTEFKKKGFYAFRFEDYNCSVDFVAAPFLVQESVFRTGNGTLETLRLDVMDRTTPMYHDADIIVFNTGHWWTHEKTSRGEDYYQEGNYVHPRLKVLEAYKKALTTWARWVDRNIDGKRTRVFFRGYSPTHFSGGRWNSGGQCHDETEPIFEQNYLRHYPSKMRALESVLQAMRTPVIYLNISRLTDYRKDGHPSIYRKVYRTAEERQTAEQTQDCSHWCLPGVPDTWNELLYASLLKAEKGSRLLCHRRRTCGTGHPTWPGRPPLDGVDHPPIGVDYHPGRHRPLLPPPATVGHHVSEN